MHLRRETQGSDKHRSSQLGGTQRLKELHASLVYVCAASRHLLAIAYMYIVAVNEAKGIRKARAKHYLIVDLMCESDRQNTFTKIERFRMVLPRESLLIYVPVRGGA